MISKWLESTTIREAVEAVPFARGEDRDTRAERIAQHVGFSRAQLYNLMDPNHAARIGLNALYRLLDLIPSTSRAPLLNRLSNTLGLRVEAIA